MGNPIDITTPFDNGTQLLQVRSAPDGKDLHLNISWAPHMAIFPASRIYRAALTIEDCAALSRMFGEAAKAALKLRLP